MLKRAYSTLTIKEFDDEKRTFTGMASTPSTDRMGDIVEPMGVEYKLPIPFLWQHDSSDPVGWITSATVTEDGIEVEGEVANIEDEGELKSRLTKAWQMLKNKLVQGLSIGFNPIEYNFIEGSWGIRFEKWEWLELSAVTIPANQDASITSIKNMDIELLMKRKGLTRKEVEKEISLTESEAAPGTKKSGPVKLIRSNPGASGNDGEQKREPVKLIKSKQEDET